ncbi:PspC family transcriptional regulator [Streptococcus sp. HMSC10A01]|uniref:PspC domain-containing protein n=1 Tax=Streptococcus sp. HMSC10A01 TaxID=1581076 RepID=UPI0008A3FAC4|nr:PspC domain-containing protein [Streptococcus sp. HMSC10A01]OFU72808.1 PspC family transcriptional regulator [Streptococcus sp. HMSC10A01]
MEKRLTRDTKNQKIAGVCAGLAKYFNVDPTLVRVLWIISVFAYAVCWFVMPEEGATQD